MCRHSSTKSDLPPLPTVVLENSSPMFLKVIHWSPQGGICNLKGGKIVKEGIGEECE